MTCAAARSEEKKMDPFKRLLPTTHFTLLLYPFYTRVLLTSLESLWHALILLRSHSVRNAFSASSLTE